MLADGRGSQQFWTPEAAIPKKSPKFTSLRLKQIPLYTVGLRYEFRWKAEQSGSLLTIDFYEQMDSTTGVAVVEE